MSNIPEGYSVIPGTGQAVAEAIVAAVDKTEGAHQSDVIYSPTTGFIVPDAVAKTYRTPKDKSGLDKNWPASELGIEPPAESTGITTSYAAGEAEAAIAAGGVPETDLTVDPNTSTSSTGTDAATAQKEADDKAAADAQAKADADAKAAADQVAADKLAAEGTKTPAESTPAA